MQAMPQPGPDMDAAALQPASPQTGQAAQWPAEWVRVAEAARARRRAALAGTDEALHGALQQRAPWWPSPAPAGGREPEGPAGHEPGPGRRALQALLREWAQRQGLPAAAVKGEKEGNEKGNLPARRLERGAGWGEGGADAKVQQLQATVQRLAAQRRLGQALAAPLAHAGPLNAQRLLQRLLGQAHAVSAPYAQRLVQQLDVLLELAEEPAPRVLKKRSTGRRNRER